MVFALFLLIIPRFLRFFNLLLLSIFSIPKKSLRKAFFYSLLNFYYIFYNRFYLFIYFLFWSKFYNLPNMPILRDLGLFILTLCILYNWLRQQIKGPQSPVSLIVLNIFYLILPWSYILQIFINHCNILLIIEYNIIINRYKNNKIIVIFHQEITNFQQKFQKVLT